MQACLFVEGGYRSTSDSSFNTFLIFIIFFETESNYVSVGMDWKLVYRSGWSWTYECPLASASWALGLKMCDTMIGCFCFFDTGSLIEPGTHLFILVIWPASTKNLSVITSIALESRHVLPCPVFFSFGLFWLCLLRIGAWVLKLAWQDFYLLSHLSTLLLVLDENLIFLNFSGPCLVCFYFMNVSTNCQMQPLQGV